MPVCTQCGEENPERARFCLACGAALEAEPAALREERKVVTVLFADLVGFTSAAEQLDPEEVRAVQAPYWARVKSEIERYGGTVEKFIGDAVMALFGAPTAHEDDPERAVRAAISIRDGIASEEGLQVRIAVTTGEALVALGARPAEGEGMASGDVVNTASRLQSAAPPNGILVDEATYRATERAIEYRDAKPVEAKGKADPIQVWEAVETRWRFGVDVEQRGPAELVGRGEELDVLSDALARARRERASQLVTLVGVPGIGKSRLVYELSQLVDAEPELTYWRQGRSLPYGEGVTFWALAEMVKAHAGILETDTAEEAGAKLHAVVAELIEDRADTDWVLGHLRPLVGLGGAPELGGERRAEVFAAWRKFFEALAERHPLVLIFEDLQWADDGLLDFVDHVVEWASGVPLLCVCTARPELLERRPDWGGGKRNATTISLSPLSETETARLLAALLEQAVLPAEVQSALIARAGGNPLYAEEYVRMLQDRGLDEATEAQLPESIQGIIAARLDALSAEEKDLLQDAAVLGKVVWVGALAQIANIARWTVEERLHALERKEFVRREQHSSVASETEYAFRHILVRDVAYGQIPRARRAGKHRAAAEWIESLAEGRGEERAELLAHHYLEALEYARAAGQDTADMAARARLALREAGDRALSLGAYRSALPFYAAAVELWPEDDPERPRLLLGYGTALFWVESGGSHVLAEARDALLVLGDREGAAEAETMLGEREWLQGKRDAAFELLESAVERLRDAPPSRAKAYVLGNMSRFLMLAGDERAVAIGRETLQMAEELGIDELRSHALNNVGVTRVYGGDLGGIEDLEQSIAIAEKANSAESLRAYGNLGSILWDLGRLERSSELLEAGRREASRFGLRDPIRWLYGEQVGEWYVHGEWEKAEQTADEYLAEAETSPYFLEVGWRRARGLIRLAQGDARGALEDAQGAVEFARSAKDPQILYAALAFDARIACASGEKERASDDITELLEDWIAMDFSYLAGEWTVDLAVALSELENGSRLIELAERATPTGWLEAALAFVSKELELAADLYAALGSVADEAYARLRSGDPAQVERALEFFRSVGATRYTREGETLLAATA
jgi:class 3 adenylate cyclase/tetratricopeptide (TPR) repeat protein